MKYLPVNKDFLFMSSTAGVDIERNTRTADKENQQEQDNCKRTKDPG